MMSVFLAKATFAFNNDNIQLSTEFVKRFNPALQNFFKIFPIFFRIKKHRKSSAFFIFYSPLKGSKSTILARFIADAKTL